MNKNLSKKLFSAGITIIAVFLFFTVGTYKGSPQTLINGDGGVSIISSESDVSVKVGEKSVNMFSCVVKNLENDEFQYLTYITKEKNFFGKTFYKSYTYWICELNALNSNEVLEDNWDITYANDSLIPSGIAPADCETVYVNGKQMTVEKRSVTVENTTYNFVFFYGVLPEDETITEAYYVDSSGELHQFDFNLINL